MHSKITGVVRPSHCCAIIISLDDYRRQSTAHILADACFDSIAQLEDLAWWAFGYLPFWRLVSSSPDLDDIVLIVCTLRFEYVSCVLVRPMLSVYVTFTTTYFQ